MGNRADRFIVMLGVLGMAGISLWRVLTRDYPSMAVLDGMMLGSAAIWFVVIVAMRRRSKDG